MKNLILTIAMVSIFSISNAEGIKTYEPEKISTTENSIIIESWMLNTHYFEETEAVISIEMVKSINLNIDAEKEISLESWMFESDEIIENEMALESWMFETYNVEEKALELEEWMF
jgi:hypothetical protein